MSRPVDIPLVGIYPTRTSHIRSYSFNNDENFSNQTTADYNLFEKFVPSKIIYKLDDNNNQCIYEDELDLYSNNDEFRNAEQNLFCVELLEQAYTSEHDVQKAKNILLQVQGGFFADHKPLLTDNGSGGVYLLKDKRNQTLAIFKPADEEAYAPNNPRGLDGAMGTPSTRLGIRSGEAAYREAAVYFLDAQHFSRVPFTILVNLMHPAFSYHDGQISGRYPKIGSLQEFISNAEDSGDISPSKFSSSQVHKIAILDIRTLNTDRNEGNILVTRKGDSMELSPIDHGYCLPDVLEIAWCDWVWLDWPQVRAPFDEETRNYIMTLNFERDSEILREMFKIKEECLTNMKISTMLLKKGTEAGLTCYEIARIISRDKIDAPSLLETIIAQSRALALNALVKWLKAENTDPAIKLNNFSPLQRSISFHNALRFTEKSKTKPNTRQPSPQQTLRRSSFASIEDLEETCNRAKFFEQFWKYLEELMDGLVQRKARDLGRSKAKKIGSKQSALLSTSASC
jgi:hypothetical protein